MTLKLQAGGGLDAELQLYIRRQEDDERLFHLLSEGEYANVLSSRQMGKTSLLNLTRNRLRALGVRTAEIDLAAELKEAEKNAPAYFAALLTSLAERLEVPYDHGEFVRRFPHDAPGQRLQRFFREIVAAATSAPVVIFLDEIDSTLEHPFTDGLFTAIRGMYNERALNKAYRQFTFCLLGVASPNELIKDRRTTPYNVGQTLGLRDFDAELDDLNPLAGQLAADPALGWALLRRVLYWSGGQPYLTMKICGEARFKKITDPADIDTLVQQTFSSLNRLQIEDSHFAQVLRFIKDRFGDTADSLRLYQRIYQGETVADQTDFAYNQLKLSGLVKRDASGCLVVRNPIYRQLFDAAWIASTAPMQAQRRLALRYRRAKIALATVSGLALLLAAAWGWREYQLRQPLHTEGDDYWVTIQPGGFCMGSRTPETDPEQLDPRCAGWPVDTDARDDETPLHWVSIAKPFLMARHETTVEEFQRFTYATGREPPADYGFGRDLGEEDRKKLPVVGVSWDDAKAYAAWLSEQTGRTYRLPSEAEWEYAARAGTRQARYWEAETSPQAICHYANLADKQAKKYGLPWTVECDDGFVETAPVGSFPQNPWGLFDMLGNVWEWTEDCWHDNYHGAPFDASAWQEANGGECPRRLIRGGSGNDDPAYLRSANRGRGDPDTRGSDLGFRLAQDL